MLDIKPLTSALAALASAAMRRGRAWWLRRAGEALVVIAFLHATVFGCIPAFELGTNPNAPPATFGGPVSDIHIIQARAEALPPPLRIPAPPAEQPGAGPWTPPPESGQYQAGSSESEEPRCPGGTTRERYFLASASINTLYTHEAVLIIEDLSAPYGFVKEGYGNFTRHTDEARIDIFDTGISITTGCHTGQPLDETGESLSIGQERSDVPEEDPRLGEVGNLAQVAQDQPGQRLGHRIGMGHGSGHLRFFFLFG